ncbi:MAG: recombination mediator RecR [Candidatus Falkowbacteria bacterium]
MKFPVGIQQLIDALSRWPTVGPKTAERFAFYLLRQSPEELMRLAHAINQLQARVATCQRCGNLSEQDPCPICANPQREQDVICIVSDVRDLMTIEDTKQYSGRYYVLNGEINQLEGHGPEKINLAPLITQLKNNPVKEIILALNPTIEGETTSLYLTKTLRPLCGQISRLARGLPMGATLEYVDDLTLNNAFKYRNPI